MSDELESVFGERSIPDLLGEVWYRRRNPGMRPLWRDMPEGERKRAIRRLGMKVFEPRLRLVLAEGREIDDGV